MPWRPISETHQTRVPSSNQGDLLKLSSRTLTFTLGLLTAAVLAGCASTSTSTPAPSISASRQAADLNCYGDNVDCPSENDIADLSVNTCYKNDAFDGVGGPMEIGDKEVPYGKSACFVTTSSSTKTRFYTSIGRTGCYATFTASNPAGGSPWMSVYYCGEAEPQPNQQYAVHQTEVYEDGRWGWSYTVLRKEDSNQMRQFTVDIRTYVP